MDLIRQILLKVESLPHFPVGGRVVIIGHSEEEINYHLFLLHDAGLIYSNTGFAGILNQWSISSLTWKGCEFLESARDETRWVAAKKQIASIGANVFEILFRVLVESAMKEIIK